MPNVTDIYSKLAHYSHFPPIVPPSEQRYIKDAEASSTVTNTGTHIDTHTHKPKFNYSVCMCSSLTKLCCIAFCEVWSVNGLRFQSEENISIQM